MNINLMKASQRFGMLIVLLTLAFNAKASYTLTDEDVELDANGYIISCSYSFDDKDIIIPETLDGYTVKGIADGTWNSGIFYNKDIESIQFPSGIKYIGKYAFTTNQLTSVDIPNGVTTIEERAFGTNQLTSVNIPNTVTSIGKYAFAFNKLTSVTIPFGVMYIGISAFRVNELTDITLSGSIISIGEEAFYKNQITSVDIPNSVSSIGKEAFGLNVLTDFVLPTLSVSGFAGWLDGNGNHYDGGTTATDLSTNYRASFPYTLTDADVEMDVNGYIISCSYSFEASMITIPEILDGYAVKGIADGSWHSGIFYNKTIVAIQLPSGLEHIGINAFSYNLLKSVAIPSSVTSIADDAFSYNLLSNITIPNSVTSVGSSAFKGNQLTNVTISGNLSSIGDMAFEYNQLSNVTIPNSVCYIGAEAFGSNDLSSFILPTPTQAGFIDWIDSNGNHLEAGTTITDLSIYYRARIPYILKDEDVEMDANGYIISCSYSFDNKDIVIPETLDGYTVKGIGDDYDTLFYNNSLTSVQLPSGIEYLGESAFTSNLLKSVTIPNSVTTIGKAAFCCNQLTSITIPNSVTFIGNSSFGGNQLTNITIPNSVTFIGSYAFARNQLTSVIIPNSITSIEDNVFSRNQLTSVTIPNSVITIGVRSFDHNQLTSVSIPNSIMLIGDYAFSYNQLTSVSIPNSVIYIKTNAFYYNQFTNYQLPTPTLTGFVNWIDGNGNYYDGGATVTTDSSTYYRACSTYTLRDEDVEMDANGYIISCSYNFNASVITIPETLDGYIVKGIANSSWKSGTFSDKAMVSVQFPSGIEYIGSYAFKKNFLTSIDIPNTVSYIGVSTFSQNKLKSLVLPDSIKNIGSDAFAYNKITSVNIPDGITYISSGVFSINLLTNITIPNSVTIIGERAFAMNQLTNFILPTPTLPGFVNWVDSKSGIEYEGGDAVTDFNGYYKAYFAYILTDEDVEVDANGYIISCNYNGTEKSILIPDTLDGVKVIGIADGINIKGTTDIAANSGVFNNKALTSVKLPSTLEYIGSYAFSSNQIHFITIPNNVVSIGENAFATNPIAGFLLPIPNLAGFVNWVDTKSGIEYEGGAYVTDLSGYYQANFAYILTDEDVEMDVNGYIISCSYNFDNKDIMIPDTLDGYTVKGIVDGTVNSGVFYNKTITSVKLPLTFEYIGDYAFNSNQLASITIPNSVSFIGNEAFGSNVLTDFILPALTVSGFVDWVDSHGNHYEGDSTVTDLSTYYRAHIPYILTDEDVKMNTGGYIISCSYSFDNQDIIIPDTLDGYTVKGIVDGTENSGVFYNKAISSIKLPLTLKHIGNYAFNSNQLADIAIPNSVTFIGSEAFDSNELTDFVLPTPTVAGFINWFDSYGNHYEGDSTVTDLSTYYHADFPYTLTDIDVEMDGNAYIISCSYDFEASIITIPETLDGNTVKGIGDDYNNLFYEKNITSIQLPSGIEYIGSNAFSHNLLTTALIPNSVNFIGSGAFDFNQITGIVLPEAQKEGYTFDDWNGSILANTEVTNLSIAYTANFTLIANIENVTGLNVNVYPNPTKGKITIEADDIFSVELMSVSGVLVQKNNVTETTCSIDLSSLKSGIYILRITGEYGIYVKRFVKE